MTRIGTNGWFTMVSRDAEGNILGVREFHNGPTYEGLNYLLETGFRAGARASTWYIGLISNTGFSAIDPTDTHASHAGWTEFASLSGANRVAWTPGAAVGGLVESSSPTVLTVTASGTIRGAFLDSRQAVGTGGTATLYCSGAADSGLAVVAGGTVTINYSLRLTPR